jgi:hypothetical protein
MSKLSFKRAVATARPSGKASGFLARVRARRGRLRFMTPIDWLLSMLLVLQLVGTSAFANPTFQEQTAQASALSTLSAAIGKPVPICRHRKAGSPTPSMPGDCDHCTLCHAMAGGGALPKVSDLAVPAAIVTTIVHPPVSAAVATPRQAGSASPRGPPNLA